MDNLIGNVQIKVNDKIYLKDPNTSELGKSIIVNGAKLIDELGLERFTFRKLAQQLNTAESSVYRYFENKHMLLIYITSWYWGWLEYRLVFSTMNVSSPEKKLKTAIELLVSKLDDLGAPTEISLDVIHRIVIAESSKAYLTKEVDNVNKDGVFAEYKRLVKRVAEMVLEINPTFEYPHSLISTIVEGIHHQKYFADHLPSLTDIKSDSQSIIDFYYQLAIKTIS